MFNSRMEMMASLTINTARENEIPGISNENRGEWRRIRNETKPILYIFILSYPERSGLWSE